MMKIAVCLFALALLLAPATKAQSILGLLRHDTPEDIQRGQVNFIFEEHTSGKQTQKFRKQLNQHYLPEITQYFNSEGILTGKISTAYDSTGQHSLSSTIENYGQVVKYLKRVKEYSYNSSWHLQKQVEKDAQGAVLFEAVPTYNEHGHPDTLRIFDGNGMLVGEETAQYDYDENIFRTRVVSKNNLVHGSLPLPIVPAKDRHILSSDTTFNAKGALIKTEEKEQKYYYDDYGSRESGGLINTVKLYDANGNWTDMKIYTIIKKKQKLEYHLKREITYHKATVSSSPSSF